MTPENFAYWLQGYLELSATKDLTPAQVMIVKDHLALVLNKKTPERKQNLLADSLYIQPTGHGILSC
jgi:hypothetical protein